MTGEAPNSIRGLGGLDFENSKAIANRVTPSYVPDGMSRLACQSLECQTDCLDIRLTLLMCQTLSQFPRLDHVSAHTYYQDSFKDTLLSATCDFLSESHVERHNPD